MYLSSSQTFTQVFLQIFAAAFLALVKSSRNVVTCFFSHIKNIFLSSVLWTLKLLCEIIATFLEGPGISFNLRIPFFCLEYLASLCGSSSFSNKLTRMPCRQKFFSKTTISCKVNRHSERRKQESWEEIRLVCSILYNIYFHGIMLGHSDLIWWFNFVVAGRVWTEKVNGKVRKQWVKQENMKNRVLSWSSKLHLFISGCCFFSKGGGGIREDFVLIVSQEGE